MMDTNHTPPKNASQEQKKAQQQRAERLRIMKMQRNIRIGAIALAIVIALISLIVSCSTRSAVKDLAEKIAAKKAQEALAAQQSAEETDLVAPSPSPVQDKATITMSFVGDCTLSSYEGAAYDLSFESYYDSFGENYFFQNVKSILEGDDLTVANLEGTLTTSENRVDKQWTFKADPSYVDILKNGGIDAVNVANNHTVDYGDEGYVDTLANLDKAGIQRFGNDYTAMVSVKGVQVGLTGIYECEEGIGCQELALSNVEKLKDQGAQVIIVSFHWGDENSYTPNDVHTTLAHSVIDAGADLVVAHHPRVLQGIELYKGKYICYSLGNFCFGGNSICKDKDTVIFQQTFTLLDGKVQQDAAYELIPCSISTDTAANTYCPTPATGEEANRILSKIYDMSAELPGGISPPAENNTNVPEDSTAE